jgi:hypothetical protein
MEPQQTAIKSRIPGWLSKDEALELLNIKVVTLWKLASSGQIRTSKIGKFVFYNSASILDLIEKNAK